MCFQSWLKSSEEVLDHHQNDENLCFVFSPIPSGFLYHHFFVIMTMWALWNESRNSCRLECPKSDLRALSLFSEQGKEKFLTTLHRYMEIHGTVYFEAQRPPEVPAFVKNHGLLPQQELQQLLRKAKVRGRTFTTSSEMIIIIIINITNCMSSITCPLKAVMLINLHFSSLYLFFCPVVCWIWLPVWRPRPFRGHSQWLHLPAAQV